MSDRTRTRRTRMSCAVAASVMAVAAILAPATAASAAAHIDYVHLGDSYAAGVGAGGYDASSGGCLRSFNSYAETYVLESSDDITFTNNACSGSKSFDIPTTQGRNLNAQTDRVTVTTGGNDIGFATIILSCVPPDVQCAAANAASRTAIANSLPANLASLFTWIRLNAPNAKVIVTGYPIPYNATTACAGGVSATNRALIDETITLLNAQIAASVASFNAAAGAQFLFAPVTDNFEGHRLCDEISEADRYINGVIANPVQGSYHPTANGQIHGYYPAVRNL